MNRSPSIYLDLVRFVAALAMFNGHYSSQRISGGLFWQTLPFGHIAVVASFVLSGLVIAYATERKDQTVRAVGHHLERRRSTWKQLFARMIPQSGRFRTTGSSDRRLPVAGVG